MEWLAQLQGQIVGLDTETAAQLRADYNLRTPDAIQMATAISAGAS